MSAYSRPFASFAGLLSFPEETSDRIVPSGREKLSTLQREEACGIVLRSPFTPGTAYIPVPRA